MATFPTALEASPDSEIQPDRGLKPSISEGGGVRGRVQYAEALYYLTLIFEDLNDTDHDLILAHFDAGPTDPHSITVRGVAYTANYTAQPAVIEYHGTDRTVEVNMVGVKT